ncbi:protein CLEC16A homolog isoform X2 [Aphidius gifuensis]|uniref:protein CLEC16A homolog isoform X2 n=1 Tax=Aphidius gifuensis TaxID=684658 RepID=UPI001CDBF5BA|nr:protein CLEC16A homolog isoform X2 [Aphidius gifuensis]
MPKSWFGGGLWKPKNPHSLEQLKYLYNVLSKNQNVSDNNRGLLVETLRSIAEILIWGDQNDSSVFDFFLEKNMLSFFLRIMKQKCGSYVCVQLLQTLNILFENIRNETSLYYLLSNNHVNSIIVHKFDFSDEEVMAYYISFLKTLSLKLNAHTIHFFYNEVNKHTNDFPLYTEAIKFFNHSEGMVRIAVRTLTLNVYKVEDVSMLAFIRDKTAAPYFSNLVWFIGNHILELDTCVRNDADHQSQNRLSDLVAEHLDHLHYLNDILCLNIDDLNQVLSEHLLHKLLVPLYVYSLTKSTNQISQTNDERKHVSVVLSLFLLSQVFLILSHVPLVRTLATIILKSDIKLIENGANKILEKYNQIGFLPPKESLEKSLEILSVNCEIKNTLTTDELQLPSTSIQGQDNLQLSNTPSDDLSTTSSDNEIDYNNKIVIKQLNVTDEEKEKRLALEIPIINKNHEKDDEEEEEEDDKVDDKDDDKNNDDNITTINNHPFLDTILNSLNCYENDYATLFSLCLLYALTSNTSIDTNTLDCLLKHNNNDNYYHDKLVEKLINIISSSCSNNSKIRLVTLEMSLKLLIKIIICDNKSILCDEHYAAIEGAKEQSTALLRNFYKSEDIFLDMFEDEYIESKKKPLNVEWLMMDSNILLPPTGTPMTGIEFSKRLPCGEVERARRAIRVFFLIRELSLILSNDNETQLPLTKPINCVQINNVLDLNNSDLIACTVLWKDGQKLRRFLVIDVIQLILVEPDTRKLGWGVAKLVGFLQDIEVAGDKDDSRCLHLTIHKPLSCSATNRLPLLSAKFIFDDHIRCMAAKQRLTKGRIKARQKKMSQIARLLDIPTNLPSCSTPPNYALLGLRSERTAGRGTRLKDQQRSMFTVNKVPGFAAQMRRDGQVKTNKRIVDANSPSPRSQENITRSRDNSPKNPRPRSEEIPLEDMKIRKSSLGLNSTASSSQQSVASDVPDDSSSTRNITINNESSIVLKKKSEETSFTSPQTSTQIISKPRRKGQVETV